MTTTTTTTKTASLTLVSFYIGIKTVEPDRHWHHKLEDYVSSGQQLIDIPIKKVLFIDAEIVPKFTLNSYTHIIPITLNDFPLYVKYYHLCLSGRIKVLTPNINKDTALFHILQISKTEFMKRAIELNHFNTEIFAWIDFGIRKIYKSDDEMLECVSNIQSNISHVPRDSILIPGCWQFNGFDNSEFVRILWYFCGGFFIGYKDNILKFAYRVKEDVEYIIEHEEKLTFEVNIWFRIWRYIVKNPSYNTFNIKQYIADHNASLTNYSSNV